MSYNFFTVTLSDEDNSILKFQGWAEDSGWINPKISFLLIRIIISSGMYAHLI